MCTLSTNMFFFFSSLHTVILSDEADDGPRKQMHHKLLHVCTGFPYSMHQFLRQMYWVILSVTHLMSKNTCMANTPITNMQNTSIQDKTYTLDAASVACVINVMVDVLINA